MQSAERRINDSGRDCARQRAHSGEARSGIHSALCTLRSAFCTSPLLAFGSAALIWAAFPPLDCGFFAWVALTPWLVMTGRSASRRPFEVPQGGPEPGRTGRAWLWSLLAGYALFVALLHWLRFVGPEGWVALALYCALYWPAATLLLRRLKRRGLPFALTAPVTFAAFEFIRGNFLTGFSFYFLAHTQYRYLPIIQIADITGVYGITFLIALVNGCLADLILECRVQSAERRMRRRVLLSCAVAVALVAMALGYGWSRMRALRPEPGPKVALVQGNVPQSLKDTPSLDDAIKVLQRHVELSRAAIGQQAALVIWPETIFPAPMNVAFDEEFVARLAARSDEDARKYAGYLTQCRKELIGAARAVDAHMLVGSTAITDSDPVCRCNSAYLITPQGRIAGRYDKIHLVIFGEYTPLADVLPFLKFFRPDVLGDVLTPGKLRQIFDLPVPGGEAKFGVTICYEDSVADLFSKFVADGAEFMVNITNDGWFRNSTELDEHLAVCTFRAVENRVPIARCANTGISALIAPDGRITERIVLPDGRYREVEGTLIGNLTLTKLKSFYTAHGDLFAWACMAGLAGLILAAVFGGKRR
jgi:apolipoprotein N-acyltransferase